VMEEIIQGMEKALPEPSWEEIDQWLNCHNQAATIPRLVRAGRAVHLDSPLLIKGERARACSLSFYSALFRGRTG
jgi:hypothetical protein